MFRDKLNEETKGKSPSQKRYTQKNKDGSHTSGFEAFSE